MARLREQWAGLEKDSSGAVVRRLGDYSVRLGLCHEPVSERELYPVTVCHKVSIVGTNRHTQQAHSRHGVRQYTKKYLSIVYGLMNI